MKRILLIAAIPLLMACDRTQTLSRSEVNFDTDSSVMRGVYIGEYKEQSLSLKVDSTYIDDSKYSIIGKGLLNGDKVSVIGTGNLNSRYKFIRSQTTPAPLANVELNLSGNKTGESIAYCGAFASMGGVSWLCTIEPGYTSLILEKSE